LEKLQELLLIINTQKHLYLSKTWTFEELNGFLIKPAKWIKGNKMGFAGLKNDKDRASVILYLNQNSDNPQPLP